MSNNDIILSQIRQRLEILYQMVDELEASGGGGGGGTTNYNELSNKPSIAGQQLIGNKTASDLGLATPSDITDAFTPSTITLAEGGTFPSSQRTLLSNHKPINVNDDQYYFLEETGVDYLYGSMPTSGAYPSLSYLRIMKSSFVVEFHNTEIDTVPTENSDNLITSGAVYDAVQGGGTIDAYTKAETDALLDEKADLVDGKVPASQLPSYVDDVLEYSSTSSFPATGENGKIYIATNTNKTYRWGGSTYVEISESLALGETSSTAYAGNKGKANADAIAAIKDGTTIDSFGDVETALANKADKSTTYTKTEVDTALAAKLDISDVDSALSSTSTNPVQNKVIQAPIVRLVDAEAKNLLKNERNSGATVINNGVTWVFSEGTMEAIASGTVGKTWSDVYILNTAIDLSDKEYVIVVQSDAETMFAYLPGNTITGGNIPTNSQYYPGTYRFKGIIAANARFTARNGSLNNNFLRVMICTPEDYAISPEFVPYAPSNRELYEMILALQG